MSASTKSIANGASARRERPLSTTVRQFLGRTRLAANYLAGRQALDRGVTTYDDDIWFVSFPRSGNMFWRFLTANLISGGVPVDWTNIEHYSPDIYVSSDPELKRLSRPRHLKSHEPFKPGYRRVVLTVRDPRDVAVSSFHYTKRWYMIPEATTIDEFIPDWIAGRVYDYGTWSEFNGSWVGARSDTPDFWVFRYEDMLSDPFANLTRLADVLEMKVGPEDIKRAIENSRPERLRELERTQRNKHKSLKHARDTSPLIRAATANQWQTALSTESVRAIETAWGKMMREFGYLS
jgi:estrone sulfotransferase